MAGQIRDLVRSLRSGQLPPGTKVPAPILEKARLGQLSAGELSDLRELMRSPALADQFSPDLRASLESFQRGSPWVKPVPDLVPDLGRVQDGRDVGQRFAADFVVLRDQLLNRNLTDDQKADRAFEFYSRYAERFVALATGEARGDERQHPFLSDKAAQVAELEAEAPQPVAEGEPAGGEGAFAERGEAPAPRRRVDGAEVPDEVFSEDAPPDEGHLAARADAQRAADGRRPLTREEQVREAKKFAALADGVGFRELADARTGKTGTELVYELSQAQSLRELRQQLAQVHVKSNAARTGDEGGPQQQQQDPAAAASPLTRAARERGETAATAAANDRRVELERVQNRDGAMRVQPWAAEAGKVLVTPLDRSQRGLDSEGDSSHHHRGTTDKRLGRNMVWNLLHRFRGREQEESALARDVWDKIAVGAILFLFGLAMLVVVLVSL